MLNKIANVRMALLHRTSPIDQTHVSYYDSDEVIPCDIVVLKDASGQVITVT